MTEDLARRAVAALERIADALAPTADVGGPAPDCLHPLEFREDESTMGYPGRYYCAPRKGGCGIRNYATGGHA